jgi:RNA polymerase-binding transcription factor
MTPYDLAEEATMSPTTALRDLRSKHEQIEAAYAEAIERHRTLVRNLSEDSEGDDVADTGTKAAASEQDEAELRLIVSRRTQLAHAIERLDAGTYGVCESCAESIPAERLELFPAATTCVACKERSERRH